MTAAGASNKEPLLGGLDRSGHRQEEAGDGFSFAAQEGRRAVGALGELLLALATAVFFFFVACFRATKHALDLLIDVVVRRACRVPLPGDAKAIEAPSPSRAPLGRREPGSPLDLEKQNKSPGRQVEPANSPHVEELVSVPLMEANAESAGEREGAQAEAAGEAAAAEPEPAGAKAKQALQRMGPHPRLLQVPTPARRPRQSPAPPSACSPSPRKPPACQPGPPQQTPAPVAGTPRQDIAASPLPRREDPRYVPRSATPPCRSVNTTWMAMTPSALGEDDDDNASELSEFWQWRPRPAASAGKRQATGSPPMHTSTRAARRARQSLSRTASERALPRSGGLQRDAHGGSVRSLAKAGSLGGEEERPRWRY